MDAGWEEMNRDADAPREHRAQRGDVLGYLGRLDATAQMLRKSVLVDLSLARAVPLV